MTGMGGKRTEWGGQAMAALAVAWAGHDLLPEGVVAEALRLLLAWALGSTLLVGAAAAWVARARARRRGGMPRRSC